MLYHSLAPPSPPSLQSSINSFNPSTCSSDIALTWMTPPSNRTVDRYFLYLDGSPLATTTSNRFSRVLIPIIVFSRVKDKYFV